MLQTVFYNVLVIEKAKPSATVGRKASGSQIFSCVNASDRQPGCQNVAFACRRKEAMKSMMGDLRSNGPSTISSGG